MLAFRNRIAGLVNRRWSISASNGARRAFLPGRFSVAHGIFLFLSVSAATLQATIPLGRLRLPRPSRSARLRLAGLKWSTAPRSPQRTNVLYREPNSRHSKISARAPDGLGQGVSGQPVLPATPPDHQIDRQRCDRASFQAGSPRSQPPLTVRISPHARSHVAWRITHYDQCVSYTRRVA